MAKRHYPAHLHRIDEEQLTLSLPEDHAAGTKAVAVSMRRAFHPADIARFGFEEGDLVDLVTHWRGDQHVRGAPSFRVLSYETPHGTAAAYYLETNPVVPLDSTALGSNTPTSKSLIIQLVPLGSPSALDGTQEPLGADDEHKSYPQPEYLF